MDALERAVNRLIESPVPPDPEAVDMAGRLGHIIRKLQSYRRALLAEIAEPTAGSDYRLAFGRKAKRSYNSAAIISAFTEAGMGLEALVRADAVRLDWRWTELKRTASEAGVTISIAPRELSEDGDVDAPMIGEVWTDDVKVEGK